MAARSSSRTTTAKPKKAKTTTAPKKATTTKTATKKTAAKPTTAAVKPAAAAAVATPTPKVVEESKPVVTGAVLKKPELIDRVVAESGMKKKDVKPVVEAMLNVLGGALANGEEMNLPPLGKVMINRKKELAKADVHIVKVRQPHAVAPDPKDPLAEAAE